MSEVEIIWDAAILVRWVSEVKKTIIIGRDLIDKGMQP